MILFELQQLEGQTKRGKILQIGGMLERMWMEATVAYFRVKAQPHAIMYEYDREGYHSGNAIPHEKEPV